jgi:CheY-like chemotaxis protein
MRFKEFSGGAELRWDVFSLGDGEAVLTKSWGGVRPTAPVRVLIVDDEKDVREFVRMALECAGYDAVAVEDADEAFKTVEAMPRFDLLLTDLSMPDISGAELARRLRAADPELKVLYFTGYRDTLFVERHTLGQDEAFLDKPCTVNGLLEAVSLLCTGNLKTPARM